MSKKNHNNGLGVSNFGFSTILLAFVMICIVTISAVSLLTANSDYKLSKKVAEKSKAYYLAEEEAYQILAEVDSLLADSYVRTSNEYDYYKSVETALSALGYGTYEKNAAEYTYSYEVSISDNQVLNVVLLLNYPNSNNDTFYEINTWQSEYEVTIHEEETLNLIQ